MKRYTLLLVASTHATDQREPRQLHTQLKNKQHDIIKKDAVHYEHTLTSILDINNKSMLLKNNTGRCVMTRWFVFDTISMFLAQLLASKKAGKA